MPTIEENLRAFESVAVRAYVKRYGEQNDSAIMVALAVARHESGLLAAWKPPMDQSKNLGAIQYRTPRQLGLSQPYPDISPDRKGILWRDTSPIDGTNKSTTYYVYFRRYDTMEESFDHYYQVLFENMRRQTVHDAAKRGNVLEVSRQLRFTGYYEGHGPDQDTRIRGHFRSVGHAVMSNAMVMGWTTPAGRRVPRGSLKLGYRGAPVGDWIDFLNGALPETAMVPNGEFTADVEGATKRYQRSLGLKEDGIAGPVTLSWAYLREDGPVGKVSRLRSVPPKPAPVVVPPVKEPAPVPAPDDSGPKTDPSPPPVASEIVPPAPTDPPPPVVIEPAKVSGFWALIANALVWLASLFGGRK